MRHFTVVLALILLPGLAAAQNADTTTDGLEGLPVPPWAARLIDAFDKPLHPVIGGVASGGGIGVGVGYNSPNDRRWYQDAEAMVTARRYWSLEGEAGRQSVSRSFRLGVFGGVREMNRIDYFGIGPDTAVDNRTAFRLRDTTFGTRGWFRPMPAVRLGGSAAIYLPDLGMDANSSVPFITDVFPEAAVPGLSAEPTFGRFRGFAEIVYPIIGDQEDAESSNGYRGSYQVAVEAFRDDDSGQHDFHRWELESQQRFPGIRSDHRLTLHGFLASTNTNSDVPFYMLYTLGGSGGLKAFRPDLLGGDGTRATLRGFHNYRFRDRDLVLMQAEYRIPIVFKVHATIFVDAGQVAPTTSELFKDLRTSTGFSLSYVRRGKTLGRMDVGFGGGEGVQLFWSFGAFQN
jgi:Omp85 superfamily domain